MADALETTVVFLRELSGAELEAIAADERDDRRTMLGTPIRVAAADELARRKKARSDV